jgi:hypothetical protein
MYERRPLPPAALQEMARSIMGFQDVGLHLLVERDRLRRLARIVREADVLRVSHRGLHEHLHRMIRWTDEEALSHGDGFPIGNLEAGRMGELLIRLSRPWSVMSLLNRLGVGKVIASAAARGLAHCSGAGLITVRDTTAASFLEGGQALQRLWLTLTQLGIAMQPMTAITLFWLRIQLEGDESFATAHRRRLASLWSEYRSLFPDLDFSTNGQIMLFRFGYGRPMRVPTTRRPLQSFLGESRATGSRSDLGEAAFPSLDPEPATSSR